MTCASGHCASGGGETAAGGVCQACADRTRDDLEALPWLYYRLHQLLLPGQAALSDIAGGTADPPAPLRISVLSLLSDTRFIVVTWHGRLLARYGSRHRPDPRSVTHRQFGVSARWLARAWPAASAGPDAAALSSDVEAAARRARRAAGLTKLVHRLPAPCPRCGRGRLARVSGETVVRCLRCRETWTEQQYAWLVQVLAAEVRRGSTEAPCS